MTLSNGETESLSTAVFAAKKLSMLPRRGFRTVSNSRFGWRALHIRGALGYAISPFV